MNKEETEILNNLDTKLELEKEGHILTYEETYAIARLISEYEDLQQENEELKSENKNILKYAERDYKINLKIEQKEN